MKRLQNRIAESNLSLPVAAILTTGVWMLSGGLAGRWWPQLACYVLSVYLMVELSNSNALLRVRSRMVSCTFMVLSGIACSLFGSLVGNICQVLYVGILLLLFSTYQDQQSAGRIFYAFLLLSLASILSVQSLLFVPLLWILLATLLQSLNWRTLMASVLGLATPYWFFCLWFVYLGDFTPLANHFAALGQFCIPYDYAAVSPVQCLGYGFMVLLTLVGIVNFLHKSYEDKIRIRLLYGIFMWMGLYCLALVAFQPQFTDPLMRMAIICISPLIAHFFTLTSSRFSNLFFLSVVVMALAITTLQLLVINGQLQLP